jgi:hypothetical protein
MSDEPNVKMIKDEDYIQEGEVELEVTNLAEVKNAIAVIAKLRRQAIAAIDVDEEQPEGEGTAVTSVEFRVEGDKVIAHVTQGLVD